MPDGFADVVIRCDANGQIGSGHAMRCLAVAGELGRLGVSVAFAVADEASAAFIESRGGCAEVVGGDCRTFADADGTALAALCSELGARSLLVDSYAVSAPFFAAVREGAPGLRVAYVDDLFNFAPGRLSRPVRWDVDAVVAYGFGLEGTGFGDAYADTGTELLVGAAYAPLRAGFATCGYAVSGEARRVMVTTGSTNPGGVLEAMASAALAALPEAEIDVVVGALSEFEAEAPDARLRAHRGLTDLAPLMCGADLVVSAAGTTLYELCAVGVPTVAVPIVDNQLPNADGFEAAGLGVVVRPGERFEARLRDVIRGLAADRATRARLSARMRSAVDGRGAERIARVLAGEESASPSLSFGAG